MSNLTAFTAVPRVIETACDASWFGQASEEWMRGVTVCKREARIKLTAARIAGEGLLLKDIPGRKPVVIPEAAWAAFVAGETDRLRAETGELRLVFSRADLAELLPMSAEIVQFPLRKGARRAA